MIAETWLRDALRRAAAAQPTGGDRVAGAFALVARRRRQRLVAASCTAALAVLAAGLVTGGAAGTAGLDPVASPSASRTPDVAPTPSAGGGTGPGTVGGRGGVAGPGAPGAAGARPGGAGTGAGTGGAGGAAGGPAAFDVYFLVDATADMQTAQHAVATVVDELTARLAARTALRHGYGVFRDVTLADAISTSKVYERISPVGRGGGRFPSNRVRYSGGGDIPEGHTFGLDGAIGKAHEPWTIDPAPAGFSADARKIVVLVTSAGVKQDAPHPPLADTLARLRAAGVSVAALHVLTHNPELTARRDLDRIAKETGARAAGPVDCDGDRRRDLRRGDPLVCELTPKAGQRFAGFADALVARFG